MHSNRSFYIPVIVLFCFAVPVQLGTLIVDHAPQISDIIIIPEGDSQRAGQAAQLLKEGYSRSGLIIPSPIPYDTHLDTYFDVGVKVEEILPETQATSTYTNAIYTLKLMHEKGYESAIIVSSDYHMRRVKLSYDRVNHKNKYFFDLTYVAAYQINERGEEIKWYANESSLKTKGFNEVWKYWGYLIGLYYIFDL